MTNIKYETSINLDAKLEAFPYQHEAYLELRDKPYAAIFHEQGLGKTKIAIDLLLYWLQYRDIDTVLIVTKKRKTKIYQTNKQFPILKELQSIVIKSQKGNKPSKTIG